MGRRVSNSLVPEAKSGESRPARATYPIAAVAALLCAGLAPSTSDAQSWPTKPVHLVVPFAPGGATDVIARIMGEALKPLLGQQVIIDNKPGAGGTVGATFVARAPADGYTIYIDASPGFTNSSALYKKPGFDPVKDFTAIAMVATQSNLLVVHPSFEARSVKELVAYAKSNPGKLSYATPGIGTSHHLSMELFKKLAGLDILHIPYRGGAPMTTDVVAGRVPVMFGTWVIVGQHLKSGRLRAIGAASKDGVRLAPDVVPIAKQGYPSFDVSSWFAFLARAGTPEAIADRIAKDTQTALASPDVRARIEKTGLNPAPPISRSALNTRLAADVVKWSNVVREAGIEPR
jgi:tripartite-type tricarboxylate transporter receptor subunit TctC